MNLDAQILNDLDLRIQNFFGKAVFGNTDGHPATGYGQCFENINIIAFDGQIISACQTRRTGADNCDFLALAFLLFGQIAGITIEIQISNKLLQMHNIDGIIHFAPHTGCLAGMVTNASADDGERIILFDKFKSFFEFALADMNKLIVDFKVSGKNVEVTLSCKNKEKLVKVYKNGTQQAWGTDVEIGVSDVEIARNLAEAFKSAITQCEK